MKKVLKIILKVLLGIVVLILLFFAYVAIAPAKTFEIPIEDFEASTDPEIIARGEYLVFGPSHCVECHTPKNMDISKYSSNTALIGGYKFELPFGEYYTRNLTPDDETGIGQISNADIERTIRYGVNRHGEALPPFMDYTHLSEDDVLAIVSYLRAQEPVRNEVPANSFNLIGKAMKLLLFKPQEATSSISKGMEPEISIEYGKYLVNNVGGCGTCHTPFNMNTMAWDNTKRLSGGGEIIEGDFKFFPPNLTPDPTTGHITNWSEEQFVTRFKAGVLIPDTPMPWNAYKNITENDVRAIYRYLQSVPGINNNPGIIVQALD